MHSILMLLYCGWRRPKGATKNSRKAVLKSCRRAAARAIRRPIGGIGFQPRRLQGALSQK